MRRNDGQPLFYGKRHGGTKNKEPLYSVWKGIKTRCYNPKAFAFDRYGGRGICMCDEWRYEYSQFRDWALSSGYSPGLTIDRIDGDGNYEPGNCCWLTRSEHSQKSRSDDRHKPLHESPFAIDLKIASVVKQLLNAVLSAREVSERLSLPKHITNNIYTGKAWVDVEPQLKERVVKPVFIVTDEVLRRVNEMVKNGISATDIAIAIGCSVWTIYKIKARKVIA